MFTYEKKKCPFCEGGLMSDERSNIFAACNHRFSETEYQATLMGIIDLEKRIKYSKKIARSMKRIIDKNKVH